ncbi:hypothetical protein Fmac_014665 [Flemingia macrophylla]|uniref:Uncharacterized protein n=1 Tax=Flemingia macrophylla TaxID=520843 RepID=A0ABD1MCX1_9FABA
MAVSRFLRIADLIRYLTTLPRVVEFLSVFVLRLRSIAVVIIGAMLEAWKQISVAILGLAVLLVTGVVTWKECLAEGVAWDTLTWFAALIAMAGGVVHIGAMFTAFLSVATALGTPPYFGAIVQQMAKLLNVLGEVQSHDEDQMEDHVVNNLNFDTNSFRFTLQRNSRKVDGTSCPITDEAIKMELTEKMALTSLVGPTKICFPTCVNLVALLVEAKNQWDLRKTIEFSFNGDDDLILKKLVQLENKDKLQRSRL